MNISEIFAEINNYFIVSSETDAYKITSNTIEGTFTEDYAIGQYIRIKNSLLNDGVYQISNIAEGVLTIDATLSVENTGRHITVYGMNPPKGLLDLAAEIIANGKEVDVASESVSRYSVTYANGSHWVNVYKPSLDKYRKVRW